MKIVLAILTLFQLSVFSMLKHGDKCLSNGPRHSEYIKALKDASGSNKHMLIYFTGDQCPNVVDMNEMLADPITNDLLKHYVYLKLSVSDKTLSLESEIYRSESGVLIKTIGDRNADLEKSVFNKNVQPYLVIINAQEEIMNATEYISTQQELRDFLKKGRM